MFMELPTIQRLTPPILESIRICECQVMPYGSIAGRICVPDGGGDESLVARPSGKLPISAGAKLITDPDRVRRRCGFCSRRLSVLGVLPTLYFVGPSGQSRDRGTVIGFAVKVPTDRSHR